MIWRFLADVVMVFHGVMLLFFVIGGFLAWKWFKLVWISLGIAVWNLTIVLFDFGCPVTWTEKEFRRLGGEPVYEGGYINHYLDGRIWPEGQTPVAEKVGFAILVVSYAGLFVVRRHRKHRAPVAG